MSGEQTQAVNTEATATETQATLAVENAAVESTSTVETQTETNTDTKTEFKAEAKPFDYVPAKFLKEDGTPDFEKLAKSYTGLEKKLGSKPNIPAQSVEDYAYDFGDVAVDENSTKAFKDAALAKGFTKDQYAFVMEQYKDVLDTIVWSADKTEAALKEEWGNDFKVQTQAARTAFDEYAPSDASPTDPVWNHPSVMKLLARIGSELGEDSITGPKATGGVSIDQQIAELRAKPNSFNDAGIQAQLTKLYEKKYK